MARRQTGALDKWRIDHLADPASSHTRQALFDLCRDDPTRSLHALRASQPTRDSELQEPHLPHFCCGLPSPSTSSANPPDPNSSKPSAGYLDLPIAEVPVATADLHPIFHRQPLGYGAVNVQGREAHMVARQKESTRSRPLVSDIPDVAWQTHQRRRKRNALHAIAQIHPSSWRHTEIATSAPPSASNPAHCPSHFSALAPPDTEVGESEFSLCRGMGVNFCRSTTRRSSRRRLPHWRRHAATRSTEVHLATLSLLPSFHLMLPKTSRMIIHLLEHIILCIVSHWSVGAHHLVHVSLEFVGKQERRSRVLLVP